MGDFGRSKAFFMRKCMQKTRVNMCTKHCIAQPNAYFVLVHMILSGALHFCALRQAACHLWFCALQAAGAQAAAAALVQEHEAVAQ